MYPRVAELCKGDTAPPEWLTYICDYLGLPQPAFSPFAGQACASCSGTVDKFGAHSWACLAQGGPLHGVPPWDRRAINEVRPLVAVTSNTADFLGPTARGNSHLPDIVVHGFSHSRPVLLDVSFVNPFCSTYRAHAARGRLVMARKRAQEKSELRDV